MKIAYRKAHSQDADGVRAVAESLSYANLLANGANKESLSQSGFLLYPLAAANDNEPNYRERIEASDHFWVAEDGELVVAYLMAYTFDCMKALHNKTSNDISTLDYFMERMGIRGSVIYCAQLGVLAQYQKQGIAISLKNHALKDIDGAEHPAAISEIAQAPLWNRASTRASIASGFVPMFLREKAAPDPADPRRSSATFVRTFLSKQKPLGSIIR